MPYRLHAPGTRKGNRTFIVRGTADGQRFEVASGETTRAAAEKWAATYFARFAGGGATPEIVTFAHAARAYLDLKDPRGQDRRAIEALESWFGRRPVAEITGADVVEAAHRLKPGRSNATKNREVITPASSILHYAAEQRWCAYDRYRRLKVSRRSPRRPAEADTMRLLIANTEGDKRLLLALLYETGLRITDAVRLRWEAIDLARGRLAVVAAKNDESGMLGLSPELLAMLASLPRRIDGKVFRWRDRHGVYRWLRPLCARLGVAYTPHQSRHALATDLRAAGYDMREIADRGLWRDQRSAERYTHSRQSDTPTRGIGDLMTGTK